jgi:hypothetical protein
MQENVMVRQLPKRVLDLFPKWEYKCPKCGAFYLSSVQICIECGEPFNFEKWRIPPRFLASDEAMSRYAHEVLAPTLTEEKRRLLFRYFTVLFEDGFESLPNPFSPWTGISVAPGETLEGASSQKHHGSYSCHALCASGGHYAFCYKELASARSELYMRLYVRLPHDLLSNGLIVIKFTDLGDSSGGIFAYSIVKCGCGNLYAIGVYNRFDGWHFSGLFSLALNTWHYVELQGKVDVADGWFKGLWNGEEKVVGSGYNTGAINIQRVDAGIVYNWESNCELYVDCVVVADVPIGVEEPGVITLGGKTLSLRGLTETVAIIGLQYDNWQNQVCSRKTVVYGATRKWSLDCVEKDVQWAESAAAYLMGVASSGSAISFISDDPRRPIESSVNVLKVTLTLQLTGTVNVRHFNVELHEV